MDVGCSVVGYFKIIGNADEWALGVRPIENRCIGVWYAGFRVESETRFSDVAVYACCLSCVVGNDYLYVTTPVEHQNKLFVKKRAETLVEQ